MGNYRKTEMVNLVIFVFGSYIDYRLQEIQPVLEKRFGPADYISKALDFDRYTSYYNDEMGYGLRGKLISFKRLIHPQQISLIKRLTNAIEDHFTLEGNRKVNLDPGYIHHAQFVLASTKHWANRVYVGDGIYAEITLMYIDGSLKPLPYTYPNYKDREYIEELMKIRELYLLKRKERL
ncbi:MULTISPECIES: DUF4416 family protein [Mesotoga]|uniref:DUF4416 domain-containing protein n=1 Tax=Mesotoga prima MesG1.Ag.4.2 TaxID=660470 RepID=I2F2E3_9BACT|nr:MULTISPECIES: DUF4416 family protein [Mesotoga]MCP5456368.1 DUF4416 family protein [Thermotogota bacterium]CCU85633.1 conserved hypothetical protein [Mesotoga infera]AFK06096.1 hypothetical protein Theba_0367 [Mesotoga prima MesG1.Ag.4.2]MCP5460907.1 DUF4416 family protein [Thermotogota bacterium]RLL88249.1 hypothetical protein Y696_13375 [Mesotoga sp. H07pep.5.4]